MRCIAAITIMVQLIMLATYTSGVDAYAYKGFKSSPFGRKVSAAAAFRKPDAPTLEDPGPDFSLLAGGPGTIDTDTVRNRINKIQDIVEKNSKKAFFRPEAMAALIAEDLAAEEAVAEASVAQEVSSGRVSGLDADLADMEDEEEGEEKDGDEKKTKEEDEGSKKAEKKKGKEKKRAKKGGASVEVTEFKPGHTRRPSVLYANLMKSEKDEKDDDRADDNEGKKKGKKMDGDDADDDDEKKKEKEEPVNRTKLRIAAGRERFEAAHRRLMTMMMAARNAIGGMIGHMFPGNPSDKKASTEDNEDDTNDIKTVAEPSPFAKFWKGMVERVKKRVADLRALIMKSRSKAVESPTNSEPHQRTIVTVVEDTPFAKFWQKILKKAKKFTDSLKSHFSKLGSEPATNAKLQRAVVTVTENSIGPFAKMGKWISDKAHQFIKKLGDNLYKDSKPVISRNQGPSNSVELVAKRPAKQDDELGDIVNDVGDEEKSAPNPTKKSPSTPGEPAADDISFLGQEDNAVPADSEKKGPAGKKASAKKSPGKPATDDLSDVVQEDNAVPVDSEKKGPAGKKASARKSPGKPATDDLSDVVQEDNAVPADSEKKGPAGKKAVKKSPAAPGKPATDDISDLGQDENAAPTNSEKKAPAGKKPMSGKLEKKLSAKKSPGKPAADGLSDLGQEDPTDLAKKGPAAKKASTKKSPAADDLSGLGQEDPTDSAKKGPAAKKASTKKSPAAPGKPAADGLSDVGQEENAVPTNQEKKEKKAPAGKKPISGKPEKKASTKKSPAAPGKPAADGLSDVGQEENAVPADSEKKEKKAPAGKKPISGKPEKKSSAKKSPATPGTPAAGDLPEVGQEENAVPADSEKKEKKAPAGKKPISGKPEKKSSTKKSPATPGTPASGDLPDVGQEGNAIPADSEKKEKKAPAGKKPISEEPEKKPSAMKSPATPEQPAADGLSEVGQEENAVNSVKGTPSWKKPPVGKPVKKAAFAAVVGSIDDVAAAHGARLSEDEVVEVDRMWAPAHTQGPFPRRVKGVRRGRV